MSDPTPGFAQLDARLLYWTRLAAGTAALDSQQARYRFERMLPVPVEHLHIIRARLADGGSLLVGIEPQRLHSVLAQRPDITADTWALVPEQIPAHLGNDLPAEVLNQLDLLTGEFEPARRQKARRIRTLATGSLLALALVLALVGIERRVAAEGAAVDALRRQGLERLTKTLGPNAGRVPNAALLTQELRRLEQAARSPTASPLDAGRVLQALWSTWPAEIRAQVETVSLTADRLVVRGLAPGLAEAQVIAKASPVLTVGEAVFQAAPLQAEFNGKGAVFLLTWQLQAAGTKGGP